MRPRRGTQRRRTYAREEMADGSVAGRTGAIDRLLRLLRPLVRLTDCPVFTGSLLCAVLFAGNCSAGSTPGGLECAGNLPARMRTHPLTVMAAGRLCHYLAPVVPIVPAAQFRVAAAQPLPD